MKILIVGGGIAGTTLAHYCSQKSIAFQLIDKGENVSSVRAAGIVNPIVFRRMTLTWRAHEALPIAQQFYTEMDEKLGSSTFHPLTIRRFFASEQEAGYWNKKQHDSLYSPYLNVISDADRSFPSPQNTFGTGRVNQAFWIDAAQYIPAQLNQLKENNQLISKSLDYTKIDAEKGTYLGEAFDHIVFAEGKDGIYNPWFNYLPLEPTKGELLTIHAPTISQGESLNRKCFMLPIGNESFTVGSTYVWRTDDVKITEEGKATIIEQLTSVTQEEYTITNQLAGVRPTVTDRRPLMGKHPKFPKLVIANGLGTKGYLLAPIMMRELVEYLVENKELDKEVDIIRFVGRFN